MNEAQPLFHSCLDDRNICVNLTFWFNKSFSTESSKPMQPKRQLDDMLAQTHHECPTLICHTCLFLRNKDTSFSSIDTIANSLAVQVQAGFQNVLQSLNVEIKQTQQLMTKVRSSHDVDQTKIHEAFAALRKLIDQHEANLVQSVSTAEANNTKLLTEYQTRLLNMENSLQIQQARFFEMVSKGQQIRLLQKDCGSVDYLNAMHKEVCELAPPPRIHCNIQGLEDLSFVKEEILRCGQVEQQQYDQRLYDNERLRKKIVGQKDSQKLDLNCERLNDQDMKILAETLNKTTTFTEINLSQNQITGKGIRLITDILQNNQELSVLNLGHNRIGHAGARYLCNALEKNKKLSTLDLQSNHIGDSGLRHVLTMMNRSTSLKTLNLGRNFIGTKGFTEFANALKTNGTLTTLCLAWNQIGDKGAEQIAKALCENTTLEALDLQQNSIGFLGASHIADALRINSTLTTLSLQQNHIGVKGAKYLADVLHENTTLTNLTLSGNRFGKKGADVLSTTVNHNTSLTNVLITGKNLCWKRQTLNKTIN